MSQDLKIEELERELNRYRQTQDQFAAIANDLNNLLAAMKGQAQLASEDANGREKEELVRVVLANASKAEDILRHLPHPAHASAPDPRPGARTLKAEASVEKHVLARILVVDDEESMRSLLARILEKNGYEVVLAESGAAALEQARHTTFDLAFLDIQLGDMKGTDVFEKLHAFSPTTHVIFASGDPSMEDMATESGFNRFPTTFIRKPFDVSEIKQRVSYILTMKAALA